MQSIRSSLTRAKTKISENLPDETDLFGYKGITKVGCLEIIDRAYGFLSKLESLETQIHIVTLKRKLSPHLEVIKKYLDDHVGGNKAQEKFDDFLNAITAIHDEIVLTYYIFSEQTVTNQAQAEAVFQKAKSLESIVNKAVEDANALIKNVTEAEIAIEVVTDGVAQVGDHLNECTKSAEAISTLEAKSSASYQLIDKLESSVKAKDTAVSDITTKVKSAENKLNGVLAAANKIKSEADSLKSHLEAVLTENRRHQETIGNTLRLASKYGMAASFKERKDELRVPMYLWGATFILTIAALVFSGIHFITPLLQNSANANGNLGKNYIDFIIRLSIIAPQIWLGWMAAKQYSYVSKIREDYSFKYASALAFEGYKKEALEVNETVLNDLINVATSNMALNPLRIYERDNSNHTPLAELMAKILPNSKPDSSG